MGKKDGVAARVTFRGFHTKKCVCVLLPAAPNPCLALPCRRLIQPSHPAAQLPCAALEGWVPRSAPLGGLLLRAYFGVCRKNGFFVLRTARRSSRRRGMLGFRLGLAAEMGRGIGCGLDDGFFPPFFSLLWGVVDLQIRVEDGQTAPSLACRICLGFVASCETGTSLIIARLCRVAEAHSPSSSLVLLSQGTHSSSSNSHDGWVGGGGGGGGGCLPGWAGMWSHSFIAPVLGERRLTPPSQMHRRW